MERRDRTRYQRVTRVRREQIGRKWTAAMDARAEIFWLVEELRAEEA